MQYLERGRIVGHTCRIPYPITATQLSYPEARRADLGCHMHTVGRLQESLSPWGDLDYSEITQGLSTDNAGVG